MARLPDGENILKIFKFV